MRSPPPTGLARRDLAATVAVVTGISLPVFLVGTLAVQIRGSLGFDAARLGLLVAGYYLVAAALSIPFGALADRLGGLPLLRGAGWTSAVVMVCIAAVARSWPVLLVLLACSAVASSASQPAANLYLSEVVPTDRQGLAFGIKQSSIPLAALLGGLAVPAIALTVGWRWAFVGAAAVSAVSAAALPASPTGRPATAARHRDREHLLGPLLLLAVAFALGLVAASSLAAFLVTSGTQAGLSRGDAGLVAALAGATGLVVRLLTGSAADRRGGRHFPVVAGMLALGTLGYFGLAASAATHDRWLFVPSAALAFGLGWGWNGLFNFAVVRSHPQAPAWATGVTQAGGRLGSVAGPISFGLLAVHVSYQAGWLMAASAAGLGAVLMAAGRAALLRRPAAAQPGGAAPAHPARPGPASVAPAPQPPCAEWETPR